MARTPRGHRRSIRIPDRDYARAGLYFVTLCIGGKMCLLGDVRDGKMHLSANGELVSQVWAELPARFTGVELDEWVVMPNHMHGILRLGGGLPNRGGGSRSAPTPTQPEGATQRRKPLGQIIAAFKTMSAKRINERDGTPGQTIWQRNYYERIIRNEVELARVRRYIQANPAKWPEDLENPAVVARPVNEHVGREV